MNIIQTTVNDLRTRLINHIDKDENQKMDKVNKLIEETGLGINTVYALRRGKQENFQTSVLSKICDYLDEKEK